MTSANRRSLWDAKIVRQALLDSFTKLNPRTMMRNTVVFANLAEAMAEGRGKAQAETLRKAKSETVANRLLPDGGTEKISGSKLRAGDHVVCCAGELIPGDGEIVDGVASVDESAITGESAPVIRESGGDRSAVTGGTRVLSDQI